MAETAQNAKTAAKRRVMKPPKNPLATPCRVRGNL